MEKLRVGVVDDLERLRMSTRDYWLVAVFVWVEYWSECQVGLSDFSA
jgi:hypothetical protein